jgi:hypothetical protein
MKKLSTYLFLILFSFSAPSFAGDMSDFQIEGMSIGDSLLDYITEEEIKSEIKKTRKYNEIYKPKNKFKEVYLYDNSKFIIYEKVSIFVKPNDRNFKIYFIRGMIDYIEDIEGCLNKQKEVAIEIEKLINDFDKRETKFKSDLDPSGQSTYNQTNYILKNGDVFVISCTNWEESLRIKNNWSEGLGVVIQPKEITDWLTSE